MHSRRAQQRRTDLHAAGAEQQRGQHARAEPSWRRRRSSAPRPPPPICGSSANRPTCALLRSAPQTCRGARRPRSPAATIASHARVRPAASPRLHAGRRADHPACRARAAPRCHRRSSAPKVNENTGTRAASTTSNWARRTPAHRSTAGCARGDAELGPIASRAAPSMRLDLLAVRASASASRTD